jgi:lambda family phage portal protein
MSNTPVEPNILDRAIGWISPSAGARRLRDRAVIAIQQRGYDAASKSRYRDPFYSRGSSADAEISRASGSLRDNMRDLVRNNPYAANAIHNLVTHAVGSGIVPRAKDKRVNKLFAEWAKQCDADGHLDFYGIQALAVRGMLESGDGIVRKRRRLAADGLAAPLQIQVLENDHIDTTRNGVFGGLEVFDGIGVNALGKPAEYWLYRRHPGSPRGFLQESVAIPASDIAHCFEKQRTQSRGAPWGTPAIPHIRDLAEYETAEGLRKKLEACIVGVVTGGDDDQTGVTGMAIRDGETPGVYNADGDVVERFEPGAFYHARGGKDIKFTQPAATVGFDSYKVGKLHDIAAGFRVPYSLLSGNLSKVNYSSGKIGLETYKRTIDELQWKIIIPMLLEPIWDWFCEAAHIAGKIKQRYVPVEWSPPRFPSADEAKDIRARVDAMRAGLLNPMVAIAETGYTPDEVIDGYVEWNALLDKHGLIFDSDPRRLSQAGQRQQEPPDDDPPEGEPE